ncbi:MAG: hypothetical protein ACXVBV_18840, partial [Isosphaeraceae bacterium]
LLQGLFRPERRTGGNPNDYHRKDAAQIRRDMLAWVVRQKGRPFFAFLNLYDAHDPYMPPSGFDRHFGVRPRSAADMAILERWFIHDKKKLTPGESSLSSTLTMMALPTSTSNSAGSSTISIGSACLPAPW